MILFLIASGILMIPLGCYLYFIIKRMTGVLFKSRQTGRHKIIAAAAAVAITVPCVNLFGLWAVVVLYFTGISVCLDFIFWVVRKILHISRVRSDDKPGGKCNKICDTAYRSGCIAIIVTVVVIGYAYVNMHHVQVASYTVTPPAEKEIRAEGYRIVFVSDLHFGTTMEVQQLETYCRRMQEEKPDLVVLGGDIVDESATLAQLQQAFGTLSQIDSTFGTYYVYGNHDKGRYSQNCDFTEQELQQAIWDSGINILEDDTIMLNQELSISGRMDRSVAAMNGVMRTEASQLLKDIPEEAFHILVDHQPRDMEEAAAAGYDLMLSGHTHAGQMWPVGLITSLFDKSTFNYGKKAYGTMHLIVSSGIGGWGYPLRTGKHCEYVVIKVKNWEH